MVIAPSSTLSFFEESYYIANYIEEETCFMNKVLESSVYINESGIIEKVIANIKKLFEKILKAISDFFEKAIAFFLDLLAKVKAFFAKKKKKPSVEDLDKLADDAVICKTRTYFEPDKVKFAENGTNLANSIYDYIMKTKDQNAEQVDVMGLKDLCEVISGLPCEGYNDMKVKLYEYLKGDPINITKTSLKTYMLKFEKIVFEESIPNNIKNMYEREKSTLKKLVADIEEKCRRDKEIATTYKLWSASISNISRVTIGCYSVAFDLYKRMYKEYSNVFVKCAQILQAPERNEDTNDIYYNKNKFDSGKINLACVIGFSGAGKSTMTASMQDQVEVIDLDTILMYWNQKEKWKDQKVARRFFEGPGSKYLNYTREAAMQYPGGFISGFVKKMYKDLFEFTKSYASSHRDQKFLMDGVWTFMFNKPSEWDHYCVLIKGTSALTSAIRAGIRGNVTGKKLSKGDSIRYKQARIKNNIGFASRQELKKWIDYFRPKADNVGSTPTGSSPVGADVETDANAKEEIKDNVEQEA